MADLARVLGPLLGDIPPRLGSRGPPTCSASCGCCAACKGLDVRRSVEATRLFTMSISDLLEEFFDVRRGQGRCCP